ncbi:MAG: hypothetical protein HOP16_11995 [Acidobacteria bacterium]|nr:hypothetical protein [Acidobacteriota bacterium]
MVEAMAWGGTPAYRRQAVKECLDTISVLRGYREPMTGEKWLTPAESERRLLAQVNGIIALGPRALDQVIELALDPDVPDPGRVFAVLFVVGCVSGREWLDRARDIFVAAVLRNAAESGAAVEALSLSVNPELATFLTSFLGDERPRLRAASIRILAFRGALTEADWVDAMNHPDVTLVAAALSAPLRGYDRSSCARVLQPLFARLDAEWLVRPALRAGLSLRLNAAHACAVRIAQSDPSWADAANIVAMFGNLSDAPHVRALLDGPGIEAGVRAAAILGSIGLVPDLLEVLHRADLASETAVLVKQALAAITGIPFTDVADAARALDLWSQHASGFHAGVRYRQGRPLTLEALLQLLRAGSGLRSVRQNLYLELLAATESQVPPFSAYDFVRVQADSLRHIERWLAELRVPH